METNFFDYINSKVLFQLGEDRLLYPIVFFLKNLNFAEYNYETYNKKLLAIILCFK